MSAAQVAWSVVMGLLALPAAVFGAQVVAALHPSTRRRLAAAGPQPGAGPRPRLAVLVPAHNERAGIGRTVAALLAQLREGDRLLVVADNCSDDTAAVAAQAGAIVSERHDAERRGKGYALDHGVRFLAADPPELVVVIDADCLTHPGSLDALAQAVARDGRPAQSLNLMQARGMPSRQLRAAEFTWRIKNQVRPLGMATLGGPCQLMGTGMALPWSLMKNATLASGHLAEDMQLGVEFALRGALPRFEPRALVTSSFPDTDAAATAQRRRWEHGHMATMLGAGRKLLVSALRQRRWALLGFALDLTVPPVTLLILVHLALGGLNVLASFMLGWSVPLAISIGALTTIAVAAGLAWHRFGRDLLSAGELLRAPLQLLRKLPIYAGFMFRRQSQWVRAKRENE